MFGCHFRSENPIIVHISSEFNGPFQKLLVYLDYDVLYSEKVLTCLSIVLTKQIRTLNVAKNLTNMINKTIFSYLLIETRIGLKTTKL